MTTPYMPLQLNSQAYSYDFRRTVTEEDPYSDTFHAHWGMELLWIQSGEGTLIADRVSYPILPQTLCLLPPFYLHHVKLDLAREPDIVRSFFLFEPHAFEPYFEQLPHLHRWYRYVCHQQGVVCLSGLEDDHPLLRCMEEHLSRIVYGAPDKQLEEHVLFLLRFLRLLKDYKGIPGEKSPASAPRILSRRAAQIMQWVEEHYAEPFELERVAGELHMSPYHLSHLFTEATGTSISQYVKARRVQQACLLLNSGSQPIVNVAEAVGLTNLSYFCKIFKELMGITPHQYRLRVRTQYTSR